MAGCCLCWFGAALRGGLGGERRLDSTARQRRRREEEPELAGLGVRLVVLQPAGEAQQAAKPDAPLFGGADSDDVEEGGEPQLGAATGASGLQGAS